MHPLNITVKRPDALSEAEIAAWTRMRVENPALYSPYFHPDYARLLGRLRDDARVVIASQNGEPAAFLPIQGGGRFSVPLGAPMTDYHGFICAHGADIDCRALLKQAGLGAFHFSAMVDSSLTRDMPQEQEQSRQEAAVIHFPNGGQAWRDMQDSSYRRSLKSLRRRVRNSEAAHGERRFIYQSRDQSVFDTLIDWKRRKFKETGKYDVLSADWTLPLLRELWAAGPGQGSSLRCDMHALYFGDQLAAIDLGLCDGATFHSWMVAYNSEFSTFAPGIQLLEGLIDASQTLGYSRIDLGAGLDGYKRYYATEGVYVHGGFIAVGGPAATFSNLYDAAEKFGQKSMADIPGKIRRRYSQIAACEETLSGRTKAMIDAVKSTRRVG